MIDRDPVEAVRRFSRFYTRRIGVLQEGMLGSPFSLAEGRVIFELAHRPGIAASDLAAELGLDAGYLSRILRGFEQKGLIERSPSPADGRQNLLSLTEAGREAFAVIDGRSRSEIGAMLAPLSPDQQARLIESLTTAEQLLGAQPDRRVPYILRPHQPGDMGWVIQQHALIYNREYGWDGSFEGLVAGVVSEFIKNYDPKRERCWIAERDGEPVGSVFLVAKSEKVAKLRLLIVTASTRGLGIGERLVEECIRFARQAGYSQLTLWTNSILGSARRIYERKGFRLIEEEPHHSFGHDLIGEIWELTL